MKRWIIGTAAVWTFTALGATPDAFTVIPAPVSMTETAPSVSFNSCTRLVYDSSDSRIHALAGYFRSEFKPRIESDFEAPGFWDFLTQPARIEFALADLPDAPFGNEGYRIVPSGNGFRFEARSVTGLFYAVQTFSQLVSRCGKTVPGYDISDYPRFKWRGLMLDVSRYFFSKEDVKKYIDQMARYKFNVFQWHLTDDQGWRIEINSFPKLTEIGSKRVGRVGVVWNVEKPHPGEVCDYGGFYTQSDIREVIAYAAERHIRIIPEIDFPGHSLAALTAYPELACKADSFFVANGCKFYGEIQNTLCVGNPAVYAFADSVLSEVAELFPDEYIHIGGDEAIQKYWLNCPRCKALAEKGKEGHGRAIQSYFIHQMETLIERKGKKMIGWDEILEGGLPPNAAVMSWRGMAGGLTAAKEGHPVVMAPTPWYYLDLYQGDPLIEPNTYNMARFKTVYDFEPQGSIPDSLMLGIQGNLWAESVPHIHHAEYMTWPRAFAIAQAAWSERGKKNWDAFSMTVLKELENLKMRGVNYAISFCEPVIEPRFEKGELLIRLGVEMKDLKVHYTFDNTNPGVWSPVYEKPLTVPKNAAELRVQNFDRAGNPVGKPIHITISELHKRARNPPKTSIFE